MKKLNLILPVTLLLASGAALAESNDGFRIGAGISGMNEGNDAFSVDNSLKVEAGYDFNQVIGIHASYEDLGGRAFDTGYKGSSIKLGADVGYKFQLSIFDLKPYAQVGANWTSINPDDASFNEQVDDGASLYYGAGVRAHAGFFYADLGAERTDTGWGETEGNASATIGFVF